MSLPQPDDGSALVNSRLCSVVDELTRRIDYLIDLNTTPKRWLTVANAAVYADLSQDTIRRLLDSGKLTPHRPVKGRILVDRQELDAHIQSSTATPRKGRGRRNQ